VRAVARPVAAGIRPRAPAARWRAYLALTKPRVVALIVFTAVVGMLLAVPGLPPAGPAVFGTLGIALAAASAAGGRPRGARRARIRPCPGGGGPPAGRAVARSGRRGGAPRRDLEGGRRP